MLWEVEITPLSGDREEARVRHEFRLLTQDEPPRAFIERTTRGRTITDRARKHLGKKLKGLDLK